MTTARATTEHRIKGHIGQPAACMIENKRGPRCCGGAPSRAAGAIMGQRSTAKHTEKIHCNCGQHCGQLGAMRRKGAKVLGPERIAQTLSKEKSLQINHLLEYDGAVTRKPPRQPNAGATVEFLRRANRASAGD